MEYGSIEREVHVDASPEVVFRAFAPEPFAAASIGLGEAMPGLEIADLAAADALLQDRGA